MEADLQADEILLNALVDGELHPADQARAAARLRADKDFARAYATLSRLKAGVAELAETEAAAITLRHPATRRWLPYAVAASLALLTAVAGLAVLLPTQTVKQAAAPTPVIPVGF